MEPSKGGPQGLPFRWFTVAAEAGAELFYGRERNEEADLVVKSRNSSTAIEVKSGRSRETPAGIGAFESAHPKARALLVGGNGIVVESIFEKPVRT